MYYDFMIHKNKSGTKKRKYSLLLNAIALFNQTTLEGPDLEIYPKYTIALLNHSEGLNVICLCFDLEFHRALNMVWIF